MPACLGFLPERPVLFGLSTESPQAIDLWDVESWRLVDRYSLASGTLFGMYAGRMVVLRDGSLELIDSASRVTRSLARSTPATNPAVWVAFGLSPDGRTMICRSYNEAGCSILSGADSSIFTSDERHPLRAVADAAASDCLVTCSRRARPTPPSIPAPSAEHALISSPGGLEGVAFSPDGKTLCWARASARSCCGDSSQPTPGSARGPGGACRGGAVFQRWPPPGRSRLERRAGAPRRATPSPRCSARRLRPAAGLASSSGAAWTGRSAAGPVRRSVASRSSFRSRPTDRRLSMGSWCATPCTGVPQRARPRFNPSPQSNA